MLSRFLKRVIRRINLWRLLRKGDTLLLSGGPKKDIGLVDSLPYRMRLKFTGWMKNEGLEDFLDELELWFIVVEDERNGPYPAPKEMLGVLAITKILNEEIIILIRYNWTRGEGTAFLLPYYASFSFAEDQLRHLHRRLDEEIRASLNAEYPEKWW